jgi:hypothetical protein
MATISEFNKSKDVEVLFSQTDYDTRKINNRSNKVIDSSVLESIEKGITSEQLDLLRVPIFKYGGQITVHGLFPEIDPFMRTGGYKWVFQNKNKSVGVKYGAIDFGKKKRIYTAFVHEYKFSIEHDSTNFGLYRMIEVKNREEARARQEEYGPLFNRIHLRYGCKKMYFASINAWGIIQRYFVMSVCINAIYEKDIPLFFLDTFGKTEQQIFDEIRAKEEAEKVKRDLLNEEYKKEMIERNQKSAKVIEDEKRRLNDLGYKYCDQIPVSPGLKVFNPVTETDCTTKEVRLLYRILVFEKTPREKLFRIERRTFDTLDKMMEYKNQNSIYISSSKYRKDTISGFILK